MTQFGASAKYLEAVAKSGRRAACHHKLAALRTMLSTGSPLAPKSFDYVYANVKRDLCLSSISGGTDIVSCFALGSPIFRCGAGSCSVAVLGMAVEIWDDEGRPCAARRASWSAPSPSRRCRSASGTTPTAQSTAPRTSSAFPACGAMAIAPRHRARRAHHPRPFRRGPQSGRRAHRHRGDLSPVEKHRRSGRVDRDRQDWQGDVRVVLFVRLRDGVAARRGLARGSGVIRDNTTPRHVPAKILQVPDIPRTKSDKMVELAVRAVVHGQPNNNVEALANPEALEYFRGRPELLT